MLSVVALLALNLVDAASTVALLKSGAAVEANPFMAWALSAGYFWQVKMGLVFAGSATLYALRHHRLARVGAGVSALVYLVVAARSLWALAVL